MARGDTEYRALTDALADTNPPCASDWRYLADEHEVDDGDRLQMKAMCRSCPLVGLCAAYAAAARPEAGMWAGSYYAPRRRAVRE